MTVLNDGPAGPDEFQLGSTKAWGFVKSQVFARWQLTPDAPLSKIIIDLAHNGFKEMQEGGHVSTRLQHSTDYLNGIKSVFEELHTIHHTCIYHRSP